MRGLLGTAAAANRLLLHVCITDCRLQPGFAGVGQDRDRASPAAARGAALYSHNVALCGPNRPYPLAETPVHCMRVARCVPVSFLQGRRVRTQDEPRAARVISTITSFTPLRSSAGLRAGSMRAWACETGRPGAPRAAGFATENAQRWAPRACRRDPPHRRGLTADCYGRGPSVITAARKTPDPPPPHLTKGSRTLKLAPPSSCVTCRLVPSRSRSSMRALAAVKPT